MWRPPIATVCTGRLDGDPPHTHTSQPHAVVAQSADVAASTSGDTDRSAALQLDSIRQSLIRQEDTIIFALIERAQFAHNEAVYRADDRIPVPAFSPDGRRYSLLEYILREQEQLHGRVRRYTSPDEHAFYPEDLPAMVLPPLGYEQVCILCGWCLHSTCLNIVHQVLAPGASSININNRIMELYLHHILPNITQPGDDSNYGSSVTHDVWALQALSKRIHFGKFVAEAKFLAERDEYSQLIRAGDAAGIMQRITDAAQEQKVCAYMGQSSRGGVVSMHGPKQSAVMLCPCAVSCVVSMYPCAHRHTTYMMPGRGANSAQGSNLWSGHHRGGGGRPPALQGLP